MSASGYHADRTEHRDVPVVQFQTYETIVEIPAVMRQDVVTEVEELGGRLVCTRSFYENFSASHGALTAQERPRKRWYDAAVNFKDYGAEEVQHVDALREVLNAVVEVVDREVDTFETQVVEKEEEVVVTLTHEMGMEVPQAQMVEVVREEIEPVIQEVEKEVPNISIQYIELVVEVESRVNREGDSAQPEFEREGHAEPSRRGLLYSEVQRAQGPPLHTQLAGTGEVQSGDGSAHRGAAASSDGAPPLVTRGSEASQAQGASREGNVLSSGSRVARSTEAGLTHESTHRASGGPSSHVEASSQQRSRSTFGADREGNLVQEGALQGGGGGLRSGAPGSPEAGAPRVMRGPEASQAQGASRDGGLLSSGSRVARSTEAGLTHESTRRASGGPSSHVEASSQQRSRSTFGADREGNLVQEGALQGGGGGLRRGAPGSPEARAPRVMRGPEASHAQGASHDGGLLSSGSRVARSTEAGLTHESTRRASGGPSSHVEVSSQQRSRSTFGADREGNLVQEGALQGGGGGLRRGAPGSPEAGAPRVMRGPEASQAQGASHDGGLFSSGSRVARSTEAGLTHESTHRASGGPSSHVEASSQQRSRSTFGADREGNLVHEGAPQGGGGGLRRGAPSSPEVGAPRVMRGPEASQAQGASHDGGLFSSGSRVARSTEAGLTHESTHRANGGPSSHVEVSSQHRSRSTFGADRDGNPVQEGALQGGGGGLRRGAPGSPEAGAPQVMRGPEASQAQGASRDSGLLSSGSRVARSTEAGLTHESSHRASGGPSSHVEASSQQRSRSTFGADREGNLVQEGALQGGGGDLRRGAPGSPEASAPRVMRVSAAGQTQGGFRDGALQSRGDTLTRTAQARLPHESTLRAGGGPSGHVQGSAQRGDTSTCGGGAGGGAVWEGALQVRGGGLRRGALGSPEGGVPLVMRVEAVHAQGGSRDGALLSGGGTTARSVERGLPHESALRAGGGPSGSSQAGAWQGNRPASVVSACSGRTIDLTPRPDAQGGGGGAGGVPHPSSSSSAGQTGAWRAAAQPAGGDDGSGAGSALRQELALQAYGSQAAPRGDPRQAGHLREDHQQHGHGRHGCGGACSSAAPRGASMAVRPGAVATHGGASMSVMPGAAAAYGGASVSVMPGAAATLGGASVSVMPGAAATHGGASVSVMPGAAATHGGASVSVMPGAAATHGGASMSVMPGSAYGGASTSVMPGAPYMPSSSSASVSVAAHQGHRYGQPYMAETHWSETYGGAPMAMMPGGGASIPLFPGGTSVSSASMSVPFAAHQHQVSGLVGSEHDREFAASGGAYFCGSACASAPAPPGWISSSAAGFSVPARHETPRRAAEPIASASGAGGEPAESLTPGFGVGWAPGVVAEREPVANCGMQMPVPVRVPVHVPVQVDVCGAAARDFGPCAPAELPGSDDLSVRRDRGAVRRGHAVRGALHAVRGARLCSQPDAHDGARRVGGAGGRGRGGAPRGGGLQGGPRAQGEEWYKSNLRGVTAILPGAALGLDVNTTGNPNFVVIGTDLSGDGIPDALQYGHGPAKLSLGGCMAMPASAAYAPEPWQAPRFMEPIMGGQPPAKVNN
ncbi:unnamed protein product [Prorocentrum cordatum]|uniref:Subtilisin n=1 Tax=Prorocentrum cordatum TaxID=2364126 RepID=A0ABN9QG10_9DINO|nr:unnamed protein product [Polarella glacialis]